MICFTLRNGFAINFTQATKNYIGHMQKWWWDCLVVARICLDDAQCSFKRGRKQKQYTALGCQSQEDNGLPLWVAPFPCRLSLVAADLPFSPHTKQVSQAMHKWSDLKRGKEIMSQSHKAEVLMQYALRGISFLTSLVFPIVWQEPK